MHDNPLAPADKKRLEDFRQYFESRIPYMIGYQMATDFDYQELLSFFNYHINNVGDPYQESSHVTAKQLETEVIEFYADLFRCPKDNRWGYITSGSTECNLYALYTARERYPGGHVYYSEAAHYSVEKSLRILRMSGTRVAIQPGGEMDYASLEVAAAAHVDEPAIVLATIGTTMTEAKDNVASILEALHKIGIKDHYIHSDGAFMGIAIALLEPEHPFGIADGADSVSVSGHKFIGCPIPCGIFVAKNSPYNLDNLSSSIEYTGTKDVTISGSRSGHAALMMWYAIKRWGRKGFARRARQAIELADYTAQRLRNQGWEAQRNPRALTILIPQPPNTVCNKWQLSTEHGWSHIVCAPGLKRATIDKFLRDLGSPKVTDPTP